MSLDEINSALVAMKREVIRLTLSKKGLTIKPEALDRILFDTPYEHYRSDNISWRDLKGSFFSHFRRIF